LSGELLDSFAALKAEESVLSNLDAIEKLAKKVNVTIQPKWKDVIKTKSLVK
jgi:hypothetical protein